MLLIQFLIFILIVISAIFFEKVLIKKLNIQKPKGRYKPVNSVQRMIEIGFVVLVISSIFFLGVSGRPFNPGFIFVFFLALFGFRSYMEFKYERSSRRYILSLVGVLYILIIITALLIWSP